jgi:hypothetical protein
MESATSFTLSGNQFSKLKNVGFNDPRGREIYNKTGVK